MAVRRLREERGAQRRPRGGGECRPGANGRCWTMWERAGADREMRVKAGREGAKESGEPCAGEGEVGKPREFGGKLGK